MDGFLEVISAFVLGLGLFIIVKRYFTSKSGVDAIDESVANLPTSEANDNNDENNDLSSAAGVGRAAKKDRKRTLAARGAGATATRRSHAWLVGTLKGHCDPVLDAQLSSNGKHLATCAEDRTVLLWPTRLFADSQPQYGRVAVQWDHASLLSWSPDNHALLVCRHNERRLQVLRLCRRPSDALLVAAADAGTVDFDKMVDENVVSCGIASSGRFIMVAYSGGEVRVLQLTGEVLASVNTNHGSLYHAVISPCSRFILTAGFTPDARVWEVRFAKGGTFERMQRVFELSGHTSGIVCTCASPDSRRMLTVSKDRHWNLYNTDIEYQAGQSPDRLCGGRYCEAAESLDCDAAVCAALSPDVTTVVIAAGHVVKVFDASGDGHLLATIDSLFTESVRRVLFDSASEQMLCASGRHVYVLHNVPGWRVSAQELRRKLVGCKNASLKERLVAQLRKLETTLSKFDT